MKKKNTTAAKYLLSRIFSNDNYQEFDLKKIQKLCKFIYNLAKKYKISILDTCRIFGFYKKNIKFSLYSIFMNAIEEIINNQYNIDMFKPCDSMLQKMIQVNMDRFYKFDVYEIDDDEDDENIKKRRKKHYFNYINNDDNNTNNKKKFEYIYNPNKFGPFEPYTGFRTGSIQDVINSFDKNSKEIVQYNSRNEYYNTYYNDNYNDIDENNNLYLAINDYLN